MRTTLALAFATAASASSRLECLHTRSRDLAAAASCGDEGSLNYCFSHLPLSTPADGLAHEVARCFVNAGCTPDESHIEAFWALHRCDAPSGGDLRRGARHPVNHLAATTTEPSLGNAALPTVVDNQPHLALRQDQATTGVPSPCFTEQPTEITSCPVQTTGPDKGKKLSCFPTTTSNLVCREGLICKSDLRGTQSCMYKQSSLGVAGIIIAIVLAAAVVISIFSICFLCCRERNEHRRVEKAAEAARIAKEAKTQATVAAKRPAPSVTAEHSAPAVEGQPLMYQVQQPQQQQQPPQSQYGMGGGDIAAAGGPAAGSLPYPQQQYGGANPFADTHDAHPLR